MRKLIPFLAALGAAAMPLTPGPAQAAVTTFTATVSVSGAVSTSASVNAGVAVLNGTPTCSGASCDGLDPFAAGCANDAVTLSRGSMVTEYANEILAVVELDFSPSCNAAWSQITAVEPFPAVAPYPVVHAYTNITDVTPNHSYTGLTIIAGNSWTKMVDGHFHAEACIGETNGATSFNCTARS